MARGAVYPPIDLKEASAGLEDALFSLISSLRCERGLNAQQCSEPGVIFTSDTGIGRGHQPADRGRRQGYGLGQVSRIQLQQPPRGNRTPKNRNEAAVKSACPKTRRDRFPDATRRFIAEHDRGQDLVTASASPFGDGERRGYQGRAGMDDVS